MPAGCFVDEDGMVQDLFIRYGRLSQVNFETVCLGIHTTVCGMGCKWRHISCLWFIKSQSKSVFERMLNLQWRGRYDQYCWGMLKILTELKECFAGRCCSRLLFRLARYRYSIVGCVLGTLDVMIGKLPDIVTAERNHTSDFCCRYIRSGHMQCIVRENVEAHSTL